jgi:hypothetical protein
MIGFMKNKRVIILAVIIFLIFVSLLTGIFSGNVNATEASIWANQNIESRESFGTIVDDQPEIFYDENGVPIEAYEQRTYFSNREWNGKLVKWDENWCFQIITKDRKTNRQSLGQECWQLKKNYLTGEISDNGWPMTCPSNLSFN